MRIAGFVLCVSCALSFSGVAGAGSYDDFADGPWSVGATWTPTGVPVQGDTVTVDDHVITLDTDLVSAAAPDLLTLGGGTLYLDLAAPATAVTVMIDSAIDVTAASTLNPTALTTWRNVTIALRGAITGAGKLTVAGSGAYYGNSTENVNLGGALNTFSGGWDITSGARIRVNADQALGTGVVEVMDGQLRLQADQTYATRPVVNVRANGTVSLALSSGNPLDMNVDLYGGTLTGSGWNGNPPRQGLSGVLTVHEDSAILGSGNWDEGMRISGTVQGTGKLTINGSYITNDALVLSNPANAHSGGMDVNSGILRVTADTALGMGTVNITGVGRSMGGQKATLHVVSNADNYAPGAQPVININNAGLLMPDGAVGLDVNLGDGSWVRPADDSNSVLSGQLNLGGDVVIQAARAWGADDLRITGTLADAPGTVGKMIVDQSGPRRVDVQSADNSFSGGVDVRCSELRVSAAGGLGTGPVNVGEGHEYSGYWSKWGQNQHAQQFVRSGGRLRTNAPGSLDGPSEVNINANGVLDLNSAETRLFHVNAGGALMVSGGSTALTYSGTDRTIALAPGAILDTSVSVLPSYAEVSALAGGDGRFGLYEVRSGVYAAARTFGDDGSNIFRGLATLNNHRSWGGAVGGATDLTYQGVATEADDAGIGFYAQTASTLTLDGAGGCTLNAPGGVALDGGGWVVFRGVVTGSFTDVERRGTGTLHIADDAGLAGRNVNVRGGWLTFGTPAAPSGATIVVEPDGDDPAVVVLNDDISFTSASITVKAGGYARLDNRPGVISAISSAVQFGFGSKIMLDNTDLSNVAGPLGWGVADVLIEEHYSGINLPSAGVELGNGSRLTVARNGWGDTTSAAVNDSGAGILMAPGVGLAEAMITAPGGRTLQVKCAINLGADGTLVVGSKDDYLLLHENGPIEGQTLTSQDGVVFVRNSSGANFMEAIRVDAGKARFGIIEDWSNAQGNVTSLGGARNILLNGGDLELLLQDITLSAVISGAGTVNTGQHNYGTVTLGGYTLTLEPTDVVPAGLAPGGVLNVNGNLNLLKFSGTTDVNPTLSVAVRGCDGNPGEDFDQVAVSGNVGAVGDVDVGVRLPVPSVRLNPDALGDMPILTASAIGGGTPVASVSVGETIGILGDNHWKLKAGAVAAEVVGNDLVLHGTAIEWTAVPGNANLDSLVGIADLSALADNYGRTQDVDWMDGDFNFDGIVGIADLVALAEHYGEYNGGRTVPEPATLAVLGVGAIALIRRRRT